MQAPLIALTIGDPAGIGPEVVAGAWAWRNRFPACRAFVLGHPVILRRAVDLLRLNVKVVTISSPEEVCEGDDVISCLPCGSDEAVDVPAAVVDRRGGQAAYDATVCAARLALAGQIDAIVTAPLNKAALHAAGHAFPGHTELLAHLCGVQQVAMMLYLPRGESIMGRAGLGVAHATLHMALRDVIDHLQVERILASAALACDVAQRFLQAEQIQGAPNVGVCALNPHAGEGGLFGQEERDIIVPAVNRAQAAGLPVTGPFPADTLFARARAGEFDAVVAMYHDQGHIALKSLDMYRAVNITLGLPIIRTSVAHGTAFDLAWQGRAEVNGMLAAIRAAELLARHRAPRSAPPRAAASEGTSWWDAHPGIS
jgi:4-hydroxythreonine-4-phosphate dehydrogenase